MPDVVKPATDFEVYGTPICCKPLPLKLGSANIGNEEHGTEEPFVRVCMQLEANDVETLADKPSKNWPNWLPAVFDTSTVGIR